ncbi:hypothetical protein [Crossiella sp. NPDC003009]
MTSDHARTVSGRDLRRLLDSDLPDAVLVLVSGRLEVVAGDDQRATGLEVISRAEFRRQAGPGDLTDTELDQHAVKLAAAVDNLGG